MKYRAEFRGIHQGSQEKWDGMEHPGTSLDVLHLLAGEEAIVLIHW